MKMERKEAPAYPLLGYQLLGNPQQPTIAVVAFQTEAGANLFAMTKEILTELAEAFQRQAAKMPDRESLT